MMLHSSRPLGRSRVYMRVPHLANPSIHWLQLRNVSKRERQNKREKKRETQEPGLGAQTLSRLCSFKGSD